MNDTNLLTALLELASHQPRQDSGSNQMMVMVLVALMPTFAALASFIQSRINNGTVKEVHGLVNGNTGVQLEKIERLREEILALTKEKAASDERFRLSVALPAQGPQMVTLTTEQFEALLRSKKS